jgi:uncharacterized protein YkwD
MKSHALPWWVLPWLLCLLAGCPSDDPGPTDTPSFGTPTDITAVQGGFPSLAERQMAVYVNAARMAPVAYKTSYMTQSMTGLMEAYPAVAPLPLLTPLCQAARAHSADMNANSFLGHPSFDGTAWDVRVASFFPGATCSGECVVSGTTAALTAVNLWLYDAGAADHSGASDGHRAVILQASARQLGTGAAGAYWTVDTVANVPVATAPLVAGCHDFPDGAHTAFLLDYYDPAGGPKKISCFVDGVEHAIALDIGTAGQGTYRLTLDRSAATRAYYFLALDAAGTTWRYPGPGSFMSVGEGAGTSDYVP